MSQQRPSDTLSTRNHILFDFLEQVTRSAGEQIMNVRKSRFDIEYKSDQSPVTQADIAANQTIVDALQHAYPDIPIVSEEGNQQYISPGIDYFWLVDPLDGTKGFINGEDEFTVNIGLIYKQNPVAGIIYLPAKDMLYYGSDTYGAYKKETDQTNPSTIQVRQAGEEGHSVVVSKHHVSPKIVEWLKDYQVKDKVSASSSYKLCLLAEGTATLYPRLGPTMEWDTAAGQAILEAAGGKMTTLDKQPFTYNKEGFLNSGFIASSI